MNKLELLEDSNSKYYCGSACAYSLYLTLNEVERIIKNKEIEKLKNDALVLFDDDALFFEYSKKGNKTDEDMIKISNILSLYERIDKSLYSLINELQSIKEEYYSSILIEDRMFLKELEMLNIKSLDIDVLELQTYKKSNVEFEKTEMSPLLPLISMLIKLINRKQFGKYKFSDFFNYDNNIQFLYDSKECLINKKAKNPNQMLSNVSSIALKASEEIKMQSLKNDYLYISNMFKLFMNE